MRSLSAEPQAKLSALIAGGRMKRLPPYGDVQATTMRSLSIESQAKLSALIAGGRMKRLPPYGEV
ncbi:hypothetical protein ACVTMO_15590 [Pseudomonas segetis]